MVLTLQGSEKQLKLLATETVSSGGSSGSGKLVPAILLTVKEKEREHEQPGHERNYTKGGSSRIQNQGFPPLSSSEIFHPRVLASNSSIPTQCKHTLIS